MTKEQDLEAHNKSLIEKVNELQTQVNLLRLIEKEHFGIISFLNELGHPFSRGQTLLCRISMVLAQQSTELANLYKGRD